MEVISFYQERKKRRTQSIGPCSVQCPSASSPGAYAQESSVRSLPECQVIEFPYVSGQTSSSHGGESHQLCIAKKALTLISSELDHQSLSESAKCREMIAILQELSFVAEDLRHATDKSQRS